MILSLPSPLREDAALAGKPDAEDAQAQRHQNNEQMAPGTPKKREFGIGHYRALSGISSTYRAKVSSMQYKGLNLPEREGS